MAQACEGLDALLFFFFNDTATTEIYTLSLHDALPISIGPGAALNESSRLSPPTQRKSPPALTAWRAPRDRKSTRLNSSHRQISYAVFCLKRKLEWPEHRVHDGLRVTLEAFREPVPPAA